MQDPSTLAKFLLVLSALLALTLLVSAVLQRVRIPSMIAALLVGVGARYTPMAHTLSVPADGDLFGVFAQLGVLFLLFFVGLQIDMRDVRQSGREVLLLTISSTSVPFLLGLVVMLALGYDAVTAVVIGMSLMPTAEVVVVPILDEFGVLHTRVGQLIVSAGTLDDVVEVALVAVVSVWLGSKVAGATASVLLASAAAGIVVLVGLGWIGSRWLLPRLVRWMPNEAHHLVMVSMCVVLGFVGVATLAGLGPLIGAITAGLAMRPTYSQLGIAGERATQTFRQISYGFFGAIFFLRVGLALDPVSLARAPWLALLLFAAGAGGKIGGVMILRAAKKLTTLEGWAVGVGLDARLTTETIVAQMLYRAKLISGDVFGALVAASALSTIGVPLVFALIVRRWGDRIRIPINGAAGEG